MKKGTVITGVITERRFPDKGILFLEEGPCVVKNTLPGQEVEARVIKAKPGKMEAQLLRVLRPAPDETAPPCPAWGSCGGCSSLTLPYAEECRVKEQQVRELLREALAGYETVAVDSPLSAPGTTQDREPLSALRWFEGLLPSPVELGYRNKMEFSFGNSEKDGPLTLGMHRRGSYYDILDAGGCVITDSDFRKIVTRTTEYFRASGLSFFYRMRKDGYLRHLLVRKASRTGEILVDLVTTSGQNTETRQILRDYAGLLAGLPYEGRLVGVLHTVNDSLADVVRDDGTEILWGTDSFTEELLGLRFTITPFSFFQTNSRGAELLYSTVRDYLTREGMQQGIVYDLYSGTGTIAQLMAPVSSRVIGVEIIGEAVEAAKKNAAMNGIDNCEFLCGDVLKVLEQIPEKPDLIILDPPRDGVHPKALSRILGYRVPRILYISCKPTSLARDIPCFLTAGYRPVRGVCVDMFPKTANVETVVLFSRGTERGDGSPYHRS